MTLHVRRKDWYHAALQGRLLADLRRTGWRLVAVELPPDDNPEEAYVLTFARFGEP